MKFSNLFSALLIGLLFVACSHDDTDNFKCDIPFEIQIVDLGQEPLSRAATDVNYQTTFTNGDQVGLYAVKAGAIVGGIENTPLTYADGKWTPAEPLRYSSDYEGATFYAYFPYDEESLFDPTQGDPFAEKVAQWSIATDLSSEELFAANDLMTGSAEALLSSGRYSMTIGLSHRLGMLVLELPSVEYRFTNSDVALEPYLVAAGNPSFAQLQEENELAVEPLFVAENSTYRLLVNPDQPYTMVGRFEIGGKRQKYTIALTEGVAAGSYAHYEVDGGISTKEFELNVGDYFCADGSLADYVEGTAAPSNVVGVIYQLGTTEGIQAGHPACTHAMVYAIHRTERGVAEGVTDNTNYGDDPYLSIWSKEVASSDDVWGDFYGLAGADGQVHSEDDRSVANGYEMTSIWLTLPLITDGDKQKDFVQIMRATHACAETVPANTTGWFLPSIYEVKQLNGLVDLLNPSLAAASGEAMWTGVESSTDDKFIGYWTSTLRRRDAVLGYNPSLESTDQTAYLTNRKGYYRFALAF